MASKRENYDNEILNLRAFYLVLLKKLWILPVAAIIGGVIAGLIYFMANVVYAPARNYVTESTLYIYFAYDENKGSEVDFYNAYTWNILVKAEDTNLPIKADDNILDRIMENLANEGYREDVDVTRQDVISSVNADIPSDVRVMLFTVKNPDRELSGAIADAANEALVAYGEKNEAFTSIKLLGRSDTKLELLPDRMGVAVALGAAIGLVLAVLTLLFVSLVDDIVYVPEDVQRRYALPVLGILSGKGQEEPSFFRNEMILAFREKLKSVSKAAIICVDDKNGKIKAESAQSRIGEVLGDGLKSEVPEFITMTLPGNDNESFEKLSHVDGVIIAVSMGKHNGAMTEHLISLLKKIDCRICGIVITDADMKFLKRYLGL
ncbi:YveK family protein [Butyrivibrio sp. AE3004]|uniref:YveK family protein n=1 Tax=Butyrivibrio sp. AE3004 TaxID=1506994 RepID=UPI00049467B0|nr:hypothetical protein [Butyrivibrio sp. AE3004]